MRIDISTSKDCCGCTACGSICPHNAITMAPDSLGFLYPAIDTDKCEDCGLCEKICQFKNNYNRWDNFETPFVYAARNRNTEYLLKSQSGAAFLTFSDYCLEQGYILYGAVFNDTWNVQHYRSSSHEGRDKMLYSKYVQSDMRGVFKQVKDDLKNGEKVLFSGTPCQVSGLKSFVGKRYHNNLLTIDLVCHGVSSPAIWMSYIEWIKKKYNSQIEEARFRDKRFGWNTHFETFKLENGKNIKRNTFRDLFYNHLIVRECCSNCHYTNLRRVGDISIGDFWGWSKISTEFSDNKGVSLLLINSENGKKLLNECRKYLDIIESNIVDCIQPQLIAPIYLNPMYEQCIKDFSIHGFAYIGRKYGDLGIKHKIQVLQIFIKRVIRKLIHL